MSLDGETLRQVARLHAARIDQGFLSSLGVRFLTVLYRAIDRSDSAVLIVQRDGSDVIGFVSGGIGMGPIYKQMLRDCPALILSLVHVVLRPRKLWGIIEILLRGGDDGLECELPRAELFSIAVALDARGGDVAKRLYTALCMHFRQQDIPAFRIVVGEALLPAHRFYAKMGAEPAASLRVHYNAGSTVYVQYLQKSWDASQS
ncbi:acetyltransferase [Roseobacter sp. AzwK-3b]|uniref:GNAT family N-acetyltransferase n=1 Tax=Roseobacter sp. AzwK-3b TaxID=351016 RepID=UPI000156A85C|nr:GNAT family N-acetyltransferase [Roseobacter sp. AzwK-3b]EDM69904.1 acetyltransferase [Roseobacter sp. AzwK-3b]